MKCIRCVRGKVYRVSDAEAKRHVMNGAQYCPKQYLQTNPHGKTAGTAPMTDPNAARVRDRDVRPQVKAIRRVSKARRKRIDETRRSRLWQQSE